MRVRTAVLAPATLSVVASLDESAVRAPPELHGDHHDPTLGR